MPGGGGNNTSQGWFPSGKLNWSLDVVTLLAVIGESYMQEHSQAITASILCVLPRLLPAPQALLKPSRPARMPESYAKLVGVHSGITLDTIGYFANIITPIDAEEMPAFAFKVCEIKHSETAFIDLEKATGHGPLLSWIKRTKEFFCRNDHTKGISHAPGSAQLGKAEEGIAIAQGAEATSPENPRTRSFSQGPHPHRRPSRHFSERLQDYVASPTLAIKDERPAIPPQLLSPIHVLTVISFMNSVSILIMACIWKDGNAVVAISLLSLTSSVVGYASFWKPVLMKRSHTNEVPDGDVIIRTREGAFLLIKCTEDVLRELYAGTEECKYYVGPKTYRLLMTIGTAMIMIAVIFLGNCKWNSQVFIGASYVVLNGLYWGLGMLPKTQFWDLGRYEWRDVTPDDAKDAHLPLDPDDEREGHPSFTRTLWYAIRETRVTGWVRRSNAAARTKMWDEWLNEAGRQVQRGEEGRGWKSVERKNALLKEYANVGPDGKQDLAEEMGQKVEMRTDAAGNVRPGTTF